MKIIIELPTWLGDTVMATPAIENLINYFEDPKVTIIGSFTSIEAIKNHPNIVNTFVLDKQYINLFKNLIHFEDFDIFFSFRSSLRSTFIKFFISSKFKYQFDKKLYNTGHQVEKYNKFINTALNIDLKPNELRLDVIKIKREPKKNKLLGINPGASYGNAKRWYPREFAEVASSLSNSYDIIIFAGPNEQDIANDIEQYLIEKDIHNYRNLASKTNVSQLILEISNLDLFITGDSGPMHVAAAFKIPSIAIFGPTRDYETSQWMNEKSIVIKKNLECQPCMKRACPLKHHNCMKEIKATEVLGAVKRLN